MATTDSQSHLIKNGSRAVSSPTTLDRSATTTRTESYARNDEKSRSRHTESRTTGDQVERYRSEESRRDTRHGDRKTPRNHRRSKHGTFATNLESLPFESSGKIKRKNRQEESAESGIDISDGERKRFRQMQQHHHNLNFKPNEAYRNNARLFLAADTHAEQQNALNKDEYKTPIRLTPEEVYKKELNEMVSKANKDIQFDQEDQYCPDVMVVPLSKKVSLGQPLSDILVPAIGPPTPGKRKKSRKTPLGNWADDIANNGQQDLGLDRDVHKHGATINAAHGDLRQIEVKKRARKKKETSTDIGTNEKLDERKIATIKQRIDQLERQAELTDSNLDLSELSDDGMMESVRD